ncbi:hypothetical protein F5B22DRAFT_550979 [Xylaria bambusicola]|uniref:uncharacterized protein n=1 Tax=Xylaria bambusicola TaxID=326684 RepID=UPI002007860C|nr:uncharacterized protein F5B22DRAFT_550979 [Xylaria bambusicola]KAI0503382.1 hypothetical protein F5B22DRAFT_550979 [Xylaria bambusicola]
MGKLLRTSLLLALSTGLASARTACISAVSWGDPRVDIFGWADDKSIWHKFYTGYDWQPEKFERIPSESTSCPAVSSWAYGRLDLVWVSHADETVIHKWFGGGSWGPSWKEANNLGGYGDIDLIETISWGENRLDIVGNAFNGSFLHKAWTGDSYYPSGEEWENLGGNFSGLPSIGSWGENRLDVVGISAVTGSLFHKYWDGSGWSQWEDLEGGPFIGTPAVSSWSSNRLDLWALDENAELNHKFWDGFQWNGWEKLGGKFTQTPRVAHFAPGRIDIVGRNVDDNKYYLKSFDGHKWNPNVKDWYDLGGPYSSEPEIVTKAQGQNFFYVFGVDPEDSLRMKLWSGWDWQPSADGSWPLGNVSDPYPEEKNSFESDAQHVLLGTEL